MLRDTVPLFTICEPAHRRPYAQDSRSHERQRHVRAYQGVLARHTLPKEAQRGLRKSDSDGCEGLAPGGQDVRVRDAGRSLQGRSAGHMGRLHGNVRGVMIGDCDLFVSGFYENRSEEHTSELQSLMRNSYAVFCLKKKKNSDA